jgi:hypothetical protein
LLDFVKIHLTYKISQTAHHGSRWSPWIRLSWPRRKIQKAR